MRYAIVGGGIIGLATARQLAIENPDAQITVLEKEDRVASHQTGHNSGVIHAGIYYPQGSLKARLCRRGVGLLEAFLADKGIRYDKVGKLVVALDAAEAARLDDIEQRSLANGVPGVRMIGPDEMREIEPNVAGIRALHSPSTSIVNFVEVAEALAQDLIERGGEVRTSTRVIGAIEDGNGIRVLTDRDDVVADEMVACGGLQSAELATAIGDTADPRIIPFRGEYYRLSDERSKLVNGLVYPVPDPRYPFLGIHLTRRIQGWVDVGPNAVLATALQGYRKSDVSARELRQILLAPGFRKMARQHWKTGVREMTGSLSKRYFCAQARRYLPALEATDLQPAPAGVRAQAVGDDGQLVDDFRITRRPRMTLVRNAPSPGATSSLAIAEYITKAMRGEQ